MMNLGKRKQASTAWKYEDLVFMKDNAADFTLEEMASHFQCKLGRIKHKANMHGIKFKQQEKAA